MNKFIIQIIIPFIHNKVIRRRLRSYLQGCKVIIHKEDGSTVVNPFRTGKLDLGISGKNITVEVHESSRGYIYIKGCQTYVSVGKSPFEIKLNINQDGDKPTKITVGKNLWVTDILLINTINEDVYIGDNCVFSFGILIMTTDFHPIMDLNTGEVINKSKYAVIIEDSVWIGAYVMILKDSLIPSGCVVGARSVVTKRFNENNTIIAGTPAKIIKRNIKWKSGLLK